MTRSQTRWIHTRAGENVAAMLWGAAAAGVILSLGWSATRGDRVAVVLCIAGLVVLGVIGVRLVHRTQRTTRERAMMEAELGQMAGGDWSVRLNHPRDPELSRLADVAQALADRAARDIFHLRTQRNEQQAIMQSMASAVLALDREQRILSVNRAAERMLGIDHEAVRGRLLQEVIRQPGLHLFVAQAMQSLVGSKDEFALEGESRVVVQAAGEPLMDATDRPVGLLVLLHDVTELRRLESIRTDFAANVSHELRTPITNISGYVDTLLQVGWDDREQARQFLETVKRNVDRLASIIEDLLALARLEQPDPKAWLEPIPTSAAQIVSAVLAQLESAAEAKSIDIRTAVPDDLVLDVNPQLVEQAIGNLVSNAVRYSPAGTRVTITARPAESNQVEIAVADEGPGIEARHLPRFFERFYRVDRARSRQVGGTGLGLAIVKHIAQVHGGKVTVESQVGKGSVFRLTLPRA